MSKEALLATEDLTKQFGGLTAVDGISWSASDDRIECIIGPNGAGKSTFLKLLTGVHDPTRGRILYDGKDITNLEPHERVKQGISLKFQVASLFENLTVRENLKIAAQEYHDDTRSVIEELLHQLNLTDATETTAKNLSHGERQWLEIGMAVGVDPKLLLLDEPVAGMSIEESSQTVRLLKELKEKRSFGLIIIDHNMEFIKQIADHVTVFHQGRVFTDGTMTEIENDAEVHRIYLGEQ